MGLKKITEEQWNAFVSQLKPLDIIFEETHEFWSWGTLTKFGTGNSDTLDPSHVFLTGRLPETIEADGKAVNVHNIQEYKKAVMEAKNRLVVFRCDIVQGATPEQIKKGIEIIYLQVGTKYDGGANAGHATRGIIKKLFGWLDFIMEKIPNIFADKKKLNCSQSVRTWFDDFHKFLDAGANNRLSDKNTEKETPETLQERIHYIADFIADTAA